MNAVQLAVIRKLNRFIHLGTGINATRPGNLDAQYLSFVTPSVSDTEFELPHGLLRVPVIMIPCMTNKAGTLYADRYQSWTTDRILLKHSGTSAEMIIILA